MAKKKIEDAQIPERFRKIIDDEQDIFEKQPSVTVKNKIPETKDIPIVNATHWIKIPDVICVVVDMKGSTQFSASSHDRSTAKAYRLFTSTATRLFHEIDADYIDIKGDGVFALFNSDRAYTALASAVTFKTFCTEIFVPQIKDTTGLDVGVRIGIDQKVVLVRKLGLKFSNDRTDRQNEVWAGKPVNMAFKLASLANDNEIVVSDRYHTNLKNEHALRSCGCPKGEKEALWHSLDVKNNALFDFDVALKLLSSWCKVHGATFCEKLISLDRK